MKDKIWLYRITHIDNLPHILRHGLVCANHPDANPEFRNIGNIQLIHDRKKITTPDPPGGHIGDYIPFYLCTRSPMLYQIAKGNYGIDKVPQKDIIYIVADHLTVLRNNLQWFCSDGHARHKMTRFYTGEYDFHNNIDWDVIEDRNWKNTEDDADRLRRKQAEYFVKWAVPVNFFSYFLTYDVQSKQKIESLQQTYGTQIPVKVSIKSCYDNL